MSLEIRKFITVSTAHVSFETAALLNDNVNRPCLGGTYGDYGWFLYARDDDQGEIPDDLWKVFQWVVQQGIDYVVLDRDADHIDSLPTFDW
ncbi:hypothetical protein [Phyllobacterium myrsinacearum]|uniref:DUF5983 domain-containing protein n=1 Tax=Phyllobacterium myrsinacearum TaxID=28101 RepID=A0A839EZ69_9HYPH|nr:hypothetical protein [Phyllobacterium myrsinacearum]MBA8881677.1 hypothetical protein [Phyllobacterium myrsinacearum]